MARSEWYGQGQFALEMKVCFQSPKALMTRTLANVSEDSWQDAVHVQDVLQTLAAADKSKASAAGSGVHVRINDTGRALLHQGRTWRTVRNGLSAWATVDSHPSASAAGAHSAMQATGFMSMHAIPGSTDYIPLELVPKTADRWTVRHA